MAGEDHAELHAVFTLPGVRRFLFDDQQLEPEQTARIIATSRAQFAAERCGLWLAHTTADRVLVGFGAFWYFREPPERELLYGVADDWTGRGYGREIARAVVAYGFETLKMPVIRASTDEPHVRSQRLLQDLGFRFERHARVGELDTMFYVMSPARLEDRVR